MNLKNLLSLVRPFPLRSGLAFALLLTAGTPAWAGDYCTDIPICSDGKVMVLVDEEKRDDCAVFACTKPAFADLIGTRATPEMVARFKNQSHLTCEEGETALKLKVIPQGRETAWICANRKLASYYKAHDMLAPDTAGEDAPITLQCEETQRLVRYKTKPKNAENAWACVHPMAYKVLKKRGMLVED